MKILSIETSCDDTAITILEATGSKKKLLQKNLDSQTSFKILAHMTPGLYISATFSFWARIKFLTT